MKNSNDLHTTLSNVIDDVANDRMNASKAAQITNSADKIIKIGLGKIKYMKEIGKKEPIDFWEK